MWRIPLVLAILAIALIAPATESTKARLVQFGDFFGDTTDSLDRRSLNILFTGDVMLARKVERWMTWQGTDYPFSRIAVPQWIDYTVVNFEATIQRTHIPTPDFTFAFSAPESAVAALRNVGVTHASLANNHSYDFGPEEFSYTNEVLLNGNIQPFGDQEESKELSLVYLEENSNTVALVGLTMVGRTVDWERTKQLLSEAATQSDMQIVYVHWGIEYELTHNDFQAEAAAKLIDLGADLIVGHHPHVVQDVDVIAGVPVFYSLGNFVFDQYFDNDVQTGLLLALRVGEVGEVLLLPVTSVDQESAPRVMAETERTEFLSNLAARSHEAVRQDVSAGVIPLW